MSFVINIRIYGEHLNCLQSILSLPPIVPGLCSKPEVAGGKVEIVQADPDYQNFLGESAEVVLFKVTCFSDYQLIGDVFHLCKNGDFHSEINPLLPSETVCTSKFTTMFLEKQNIFYPNILLKTVRNILVLSKPCSRQ